MEICDPKELGFDPDRLARLTALIRAEIQAERWDGCELVVGRHGRVAYHECLGFADRAARRPVEPDQPFITMSIGKQFVVSVLLAHVERADLALTTRVAELIPEFGARGKSRITVAQLLTHTSGLLAMMPPVAPEDAGDLAKVVAAICDSAPESLPGTRVTYSVIAAHAILGELVRRADGGRRSLREILDAELFRPLAMRSSSLGVRPDLAKRLAPVVVRDRRDGLFEPEMLESLGQGIGETTEIPAGGYVSTAPDVWRFAEMLRRGGELEGVRILSPAMLELVRVDRTGERPNSLWDYTFDLRGWDPFPSRLGLGFFLRGPDVHPTPFGLLASAHTFGGFGAGSTAFWVDPARDVSYAFLSSGLLEDSYSVERHQRLADLVHAAIVA